MVQSELKILDTRISDNGVYICHAKSESGSDQQAFTVEVIGEAAAATAALIRSPLAVHPEIVRKSPNVVSGRASISGNQRAFGLQTINRPTKTIVAPPKQNLGCCRASQLLQANSSSNAKRPATIRKRNGSTETSRSPTRSCRPPRRSCTKTARSQFAISATSASCRFTARSRVSADISAVAKHATCRRRGRGEGRVCGEGG